MNGQGDDVAVGIDLNAGSVDFSHVGAASNPQAVPIRCTFTNRYEAKSRITLTKTVVGGGAQPGNWNLSATGATDDPVTKSTVVSGRANSAQVTSVVVPSGDYTLGESLNTTVYGYEFTDLICRDSSGRTITTRDADGSPANRANDSPWPRMPRSPVGSPIPSTPAGSPSPRNSPEVPRGSMTTAGASS